jgi:protein involved in polysaccharide export with SLBB domain
MSRITDLLQTVIERSRRLKRLRRRGMSILLGSAGLLLCPVPPLHPQPRSATPAVNAAATQALRPGDLVRVQIYREPELSGEFLVDENGTVVLPRLGPLDIAGQAPGSLRARLTSMYEEFLNHSSISVTLLRRVHVLGAVHSPGLYPVDATHTVADALARAGGTTSMGDPKRLILIRDGERLPVRLTPGAQLSASPVRSGDQIYVPERGWVSRNPGVVASALTAVVTMVFAFRR